MATKETFTYICDGCDQLIDLDTQPHLVNVYVKSWAADKREPKSSLPTDLHEDCIGLYFTRALHGHVVDPEKADYVTTKSQTTSRKKAADK